MGSSSDKWKWRLVTFWNDPAKTIRAGAGDSDTGYDDLGAWSSFKRSLTRRWTSQIRLSASGDESMTTELEEGKGDSDSHIESRSPEQAAYFMRTAATGDTVGGKIEVPGTPVVEATTFAGTEPVLERPGSKASDSGVSGIMVEEEPSGWLGDYAVKKGGGVLY